MLSDIDALYEKDPRKFKDAMPISMVYEITEQLEKSAGKKGSTFATGGMKSKIAAAKIGVKFGGWGINLPKAKTPEIYKNIVIVFIIVSPQPIVLYIE